MSDSMYNNDDIYSLLNEEIGVDQDKIMVNVDKIDGKMSILVDTLKKMQVQLNILQTDNKTLKAENTAIMKKLSTVIENQNYMYLRKDNA